jgi:Xaa-Pro aminopeptidase
MQLVGLLRSRRPQAQVADLTPILDELRTIKSPREVALLRKAGILAGLGMMEAIRSTEVGIWEYQLDAAARYVFLVNGSRLDAYRSIIASGTENINNQHYFRGNRQLRNGDLVLMDYAPDIIPATSAASGPPTVNIRRCSASCSNPSSNIATSC